MSLDFFSRLRGTEFVPIWYPPPEVDEKELIGRRLLDRAGKERATSEDGRPLYDVDDFYDTRLEHDLSVDRLGNPNPTLDTLREITKLADEEAARPESNRVFIGWATIRVQNLRFPGWAARVTASPTLREDGTVETTGMQTSTGMDFARRPKPMRWRSRFSRHLREGEDIRLLTAGGSKTHRQAGGSSP